MFLFPLQLLFETFLVLRRNERDLIKNVYWLSCKLPIILARFKATGIFEKYSNIKLLLTSTSYNTLSLYFANINGNVLAHIRITEGTVNLALFDTNSFSFPAT